MSTRFLTVTQVPAIHPAFTEQILRWLIFKQEDNGLRKSGAVVRIGRKVLIDEERFLEWVRSHGEVVSEKG
jgi:hypothetical protein